MPGSDGAAVIDLKAETDRGKPFTGGGLVSKDLMRYGYYETRVWINKGPGWHTAFWSMCGGADGVHKRQLAEIDGFEIDSIHPNRVINNVFDHRPPRRQVTSGWYDVGSDCPRAGTSSATNTTRPVSGSSSTAGRAPTWPIRRARSCMTR